MEQKSRLNIDRGRQKKEKEMPRRHQELASQPAMKEAKTMTYEMKGR